MKNLLLVLSLFFVNLSFSNTITQVVHHTQGGPYVNSCSSAKFIVNYTVNGVGYSAVSSIVVIDENSSYTFSVNIPSGKGVVIISKQVQFYFSGNSSTYTYTMIGSSNSDSNTTATNRCSGVSSRLLQITETSTEVQFYTDDWVG